MGVGIVVVEVTLVAAIVVSPAVAADAVDGVALAVAAMEAVAFEGEDEEANALSVQREQNQSPLGTSARPVHRKWASASQRSHSNTGPKPTTLPSPTCIVVVASLAVLLLVLDASTVAPPHM